MAVELTASRSRHRRRGARLAPLRAAPNGFSLAEIAISAMIFLMMMVGIIPLFTQATANNASAGESSEGVNFARSQLEEFSQLPFNSPQLVPNSASPREEYFSLAEHRWVSGAPPEDGSDPALVYRTTTIRQYNATALQDGFLDPDTEALPDDSHGAWVHLKEITVDITTGRSGSVIGTPQNFTFKIVKSK